MSVTQTSVAEPDLAPPRPATARRYVPLMWAAAAVVAALVIPQIASEYWLFIVLLVLINAVATQGLNFVMGYAGQVSLGHAGFVGIGAYAVAISTTSAHLPMWVGVAIAIAVCGVVGMLVALPSLTLNDLYLAAVTYAFGQAVVVVTQNWTSLTGGPSGMAVTGASLSGTDGYAYELAVGCTAIVWIVTWRIVRSPYGRALVAVRENQTAAKSLGLDLRHLKVMAFVYSAVCGAVAGFLYSYIFGLVNPDAFAFVVSLSYLTMVVIGGLGTLLGPLIGAAIITTLSQVASGWGTYQEVISGAALLFFLVFFREGLVGMAREAGRSIGRRRR